MVKTAASVDLLPIDRLEEKIKQLVSMVDQLRGERATAVDEVARLQRELDTMRTRLGDAEGAGAEVSTLREEREVIKGRVAEMISQIEKLGI
jgi:regulator of replication initiation timing